MFGSSYWALTAGDLFFVYCIEFRLPLAEIEFDAPFIIGRHELINWGALEFSHGANKEWFGNGALVCAAKFGVFR